MEGRSLVDVDHLCGPELRWTGGWVVAGQGGGGLGKQLQNGGSILETFFGPTPTGGIRDQIHDQI